MKALLLSLLLLPGFTQRAVEPVRVSVRAPLDATNDAVSKALRDELRAARVVITDSRADYVIQINALPIVGAGCEGFAAGVLAPHDGKMVLRAYTSPTASGLAKLIMADANLWGN